jgi:hypothetical protein
MDFAVWGELLKDRTMELTVGTTNLQLKLLKHCGNYMYHLLQQPGTLSFTLRVYLWVSNDSQNEQLLFS